MQPIFEEMIKMWEDLGYPLPIQEGRFWLDNHFICGFNSNGELIKLYKYRVFEDLSIKISSHKDAKINDINQYETWSETLNRLDDELSVMESKALSIINEAVTKYFKHKKYILVSTGKDSMVTLHLVKRRVQKPTIYFNNTTLDVADTYKMVKKHKNWHIINPDYGFYQHIKENNFIPTRFSRECCGLFKETQAMQYFNKKDKICFFMGIRNDESYDRADRKDFDHNPIWRQRNWISCLPIREWSELYIWLYIFKYNLEINNKYRKGYKRVGCGIACPYYTKYTWVLDKYWYRYLFDRWHEILRKDFIQNERWTKLNCTIEEYVNEAWHGGLYRAEPTDKVIEEFMKHKGISQQTALQYFNQVCCICNKNVRQSEVIAMNLKLFGRNTNKIYCKKHLMEQNKMNNEDWNDAIADFKRQGCALF